MKKIVFRNFRYMYCDDFASFLQEMSEKGYHFSRWGIGLEFEKGQPEKRIYRVEVFQNASDLDMKAEYDTNEYGDYCEAAGWKLIDSRRKFCIFRKERMDAPDIVTEEERFSIIRKAELSLRLREFLCFLLISLLYVWRFGESGFINLAFSNLFLGFMAFFIFYPLVLFLLLMGTLLRFRNYAKQLEENRTLFYGIKNKKVRALQQHSSIIFVLMIMLLMLIGCLFYLGIAYTFVSIAYVVILRLVDLGIVHFRPSRENLVSIRIVAAIGAGLLFSLLLYYVKPHTKTQPLEPVLVTESILGQKYRYDLTSLDTNVPFPENTTVVIYESPYTWVLDKSMESASAVFRRLNCEVDTTEDWLVEKAVSNVLSNCHVIRLPDKVVDISASTVIKKEEYPAFLREIEEIHKNYPVLSK